MVVSHNDIDSRFLGKGNSLMACYPIVHCHNQGYTLLLDEIFIDRLVGSIAIRKTIGQIDLAFCSQLLQGFLQDGGRGHAIGIIVPVY